MVKKVHLASILLKCMYTYEYVFCFDEKNNRYFIFYTLNVFFSFSIAEKWIMVTIYPFLMDNSVILSQRTVGYHPNKKRNGRASGSLELCFCCPPSKRKIEFIEDNIIFYLQIKKRSKWRRQLKKFLRTKDRWSRKPMNEGTLYHFSAESS